MKPVVRILLLATSTALAGTCRSAPSDCGPPPAAVAAAASGDRIDLSEKLGGGRLRSVNRAVTAFPGGGGIRVTAAPGVGVIWLEGTDFAEGTIEADVCGRDIDGESFVGIAFHGRSDETYEAVYLRPFDFRSRSADRRRHAVQYVAMPSNDYARLRATFPGEFEGSVDSSVVPDGWNRLRLVVGGGRVQVFVGKAGGAALEVRELQSERHGRIGLYVDNGSDGAFANLRMARTF